VATSLGRRSPQGGDQEPPDWSPVTEPPPTKARQTLEIVVRGLIAVGVAALLWALGRPHFAIVLVVVATALTAASLLWPGFAAGVDRAVSALQRWAGRVLALVLVGGLQVFVFMPLWLILRLVRHDPLALGAGPDDETFWRPVPRGSPKLYRRPFAYERLPRVVRGGDRFPLPRLRAALGLVALLLVLDVGIGAAIDGLRDLGSSDAAKSGGGLAGQNVPASAGETWRVPLGDEINQVWDTKRYDPYLGWTMPDFHGRYLNVVHGLRRSYEPPASGTGRPLSVYLFGGSTMFGLYQRDEHTIPSEFARLAQRDGIPVHVVNYGRLAYVNWQETLELQQLVSQGRAPDLAVFYDGFNEVLGQFQLGPHSQPTHLEAQQVEKRLGLGQRGPLPGEAKKSWPRAAYDSWADVSLVHRLGSSLGLWSQGDATGEPLVSSIWPGDQTKETGRRGALAASIYGRGVDLDRRFAGSYGFETAFFWQPFLYSKHIVPGEEELRGWLGTDADAWRAADRSARSHLDPAVVDLSDSLNGVSKPVMYDFVHTNELGARVVARALYERLRPELLRLSQGQRP
jgi:lysophospholipase L1-like esterase